MQALEVVRVCSILLPITVLCFGPSDAVAYRIWNRQPLRTWHYETIVVSLFLALVVIFSGNKPEEWVGFAALVLAHGRNSIMFRMSEQQARLNPTSAEDAKHHVECHHWSRRYFLMAEACWAAYFIWHKAWAALAGVVVFVGYGLWRSWYNRKPPTSSKSPTCNGCGWCLVCASKKQRSLLLVAALLASCSTHGQEGTGTHKYPPDVVCSCSFPNSVAACDSENNCFIDECTLGYTDCNFDDGDGCETNTGGDATNCGACEHHCYFGPHSTPHCTFGRCGLICDYPFLNCDRRTPNGCETDGSSDGNHCGSCGVACAFGEVCTRGICIKQ